MRTSIRGFLAATLLAGTALAATPVFAQDETDPPSEFTFTGGATLVTDYRFRGLSLSAGDPAIQGTIGVAHSSGFYVGVWGSSLSSGDRFVSLDDGTGDVFDYEAGTFGSVEIDIYGGWAGEVAPGLNVDVGLLYYYYPNAQDRAAEFSGVGPSGYPEFDGYSPYPTDLFEPYASVSYGIGPATAKLGLAYAWKQEALGDDDNLYVYFDLSSGIPGTPISVAGRIGYTDGPLSPNVLTAKSLSGGWDYSIGATFAVTDNIKVGATYVGVDGNSIEGFSDDTVVGSLSISF